MQTLKDISQIIIQVLLEDGSTINQLHKAIKAQVKKQFGWYCARTKSPNRRCCVCGCVTSPLKFCLSCIAIGSDVSFRHVLNEARSVLDGGFPVSGVFSNGALAVVNAKLQSSSLPTSASKSPSALSFVKTSRKSTGLSSPRNTGIMKWN